MSDNIIIEKSLDFAVRIVKLANYLNKEKKEYTMANQILRSGTSIGANIHEAQYAQSKADFVSKSTISQKETFETMYWLNVLFRTEYINEIEYKSLYSDAEEIMKILSRIIVSSKSQNLK